MSHCLQLEVNLTLLTEQRCQLSRAIHFIRSTKRGYWKYRANKLEELLHLLDRIIKQCTGKSTLKETEMSRCFLKANPETNAKEVFVGIDPGLSCWFFQAYAARDSEGEDVLLEWLPRASRGQVVDKIHEWADMDDPYTKLVLNSIALDLDPGDIPLSKRYVEDV